MSSKKISVIIPAYNESKYIETPLRILRKQADADGNVEIIVVDNSSDNGKTGVIAKKYADKVISFSGPIGLANARNEGARAADGQIFLFSDADSHLSDNAFNELRRIEDGRTVGTFWGRADSHTASAYAFFLMKNWTHWLRIYSGFIAGTLFCSKNIFSSMGGFQDGKEPVELRDFLSRAKKVGAHYRLIANADAITSMRRYEEKGYLKNIMHWITFKNKKLAKDYYKLNIKE
jgi:glycosyltransferase involved in cell wall biosynthesis